MPPTGFEILAPVMCALREEISLLREEVSELRRNNENDVRTINNVNTVVQDVSEIKVLVQQAISSANTGSDETPPLVQSIPQAGGSSSLNEAPATNTLHGTRTSGDDNEWQEVHNRPYSNALRRNGLPANLQRRNTNIQRRNDNSTSQQDENFRQPPNRLGISRQRRPAIEGRRTSESNIAGGERIYDIFIGGCGINTEAAAITEFCEKYGVPIKKCEAISSVSSWSKSFKASATSENRDKLLDGAFWPVGVYVRKFFRKRTRND